MTSIKYCGSFLDSSGYGSANRAFIAALFIAGVDVTTELAVHMKEQVNVHWTGELAINLKNRNISYQVKIIHLTPDLYENYVEKGKYNIGHLFWEVDKLPQDWVDKCNRMDEIWTSSAHMVELFKSCGVKVPVYAFAQPIDISMADKDYKKYALIGHTGLLFYSIFQWIERKNPKLLLKAFWEAFEGHDDVSLLLKTFRLSYDQSEFDKIRNDIWEWKREMGKGIFPKVYLTSKAMHHDEIMRVHRTGDVFVLPHRGEGWNRCIAESLLMGNVVTATARGGIHEYLRDEHYFGLPSKMVPVTEVPWIKFYTKDQNWAEADKEYLIKTMKYIYKNYELCKAKGITAREYVKENFNYYKIGYLMRERLEEIYKKL